MLVFIIIPSVVYADAGPKPSITVNAVNMPDECYMDLLVKVDSGGFKNEEFNSEEYSSLMVKALSEYDVEGWRAGVVNELFMTFDDVKCEIIDGNCTKSFGYHPPDVFKIIVVDKNGNTAVSNIIERKRFNSTVDFDYETGQASERSILPNIIWQFMVTFVLTLLVEAAVLLIFRFSFRRYWGLILGVNFVTQLLLHSLVGWGLIMGGGLIALIFFVIAEIAIFITEGIIYGFTLKEHKVIRRILYTLTANILSLIIGGVVMVMIF